MTVEKLPVTVVGIQEGPVVAVEVMHTELSHVVGNTVDALQDVVAGQKLGQFCDLDVVSVLLQQPTVVVKFP